MQPADSERLQSLQNDVLEIQELLLDVATGSAKWQEKSDRYTDLYRKIDIEIQSLQDDHFLLSNPNSTASLKAIKDYLSSVFQAYVPRRRYIFELYADLLTQIEKNLFQVQFRQSQELGHNNSLLSESLEKLLEEIQELQEIMTDVATGKSRLENEEECYTELYRDASCLIWYFQEKNVQITNPNPFRFIWHWHSYWKLEIEESREARKEYIRNIYNDLEKSIHSVLHRYRVKNLSQEELLQKLRQQFEQHYPSQDTQRKLIPCVSGKPASLVSFSQSNPIRKRWAMLVGINRYAELGVSHLNYCVNDVIALEKVLKNLGYTVVCLNDELEQHGSRYPSKNNVVAELIRLCEVVEPDDLLFVHFSCHGTLLGTEPTLILQDTRLPILAETGLKVVEIRQRIQQSKARRLVMCLDACHVGVEIGRSLTDGKFIHYAHDLAEGFALLAASTAQQVAQEDSEQQRGVFTRYLLEGLSGKADRKNKKFVTVDDLKNFTIGSLQEWSIQHGKPLQYPTAHTEGFGDMILADYRDLAEFNIS